MGRISLVCSCQGLHLLLGKYVIQNVAAQNNGEKTKVKVKVRINTHGIFSVSTASMVEQVKAEENENPSVESEAEAPSQIPNEDSCDVSCPLPQGTPNREAAGVGRFCGLDG